MVFKMLNEDQMIIGNKKKLFFWGIKTKKMNNLSQILINSSKIIKENKYKTMIIIKILLQIFFIYLKKKF